MLFIVSGHDFVLDPSLVNNNTAVELPSFARSEPTATAAVTTTFEFSEDPSSNEIEVEITTMSFKILFNTIFCSTGHYRGQNTDRGSS